MTTQTCTPASTDTDRQRTFPHGDFDLVEFFGCTKARPVGITAGRRLYIAFPHDEDGSTRWRGFIPNSILSMAAERSRCPITAVDRARDRGEDLHWLTQKPTTVSIFEPSSKRELYLALHIGDHVTFQGRLFRLDAAPNENVNLVDLGPR